LSGSLKRKFSHRFPGIVWNTIALPEKDIILLEVRNHERKQVSFSAWQYASDLFLWQDVTLDELWWVNLSAAAGDVVLFTIYLDTSNPDKKGLLAYSLYDTKLLWWHNDFSILSVNDLYVNGISTKTGTKEIVLDVLTGKELAGALPELQEKKTANFFKPSLYAEDTAYFSTVKTFLESGLNLLPVTALEYLEHDGRIFISYYVQENGLANYLLVLSLAGEVLLHEKLDESLKGIGQDTFFILAGCVIFVKNKCELISYFL